MQVLSTGCSIFRLDGHRHITMVSRVVAFPLLFASKAFCLDPLGLKLSKPVFVHFKQFIEFTQTEGVVDEVRL